MQQLTTIQLVSVSLLPIIFAITVHEASHGYMAKLLGDKTAFILGRITLNPLKHIDLVGTVMVPLILLYLGGIVFGWAKPVPVSQRNFQRPRRDMALVALVGPLSNFFMAIIWAVIAKLGMLLLHHGFYWGLAIGYMGQAGIMINLGFFVLNFLPIPPLDGGHMLVGLLPKKVAFYFERFAGISFIFLVILLASGYLSKIIEIPLFYLVNLFNIVLGV